MIILVYNNPVNESGEIKQITVEQLVQDLPFIGDLPEEEISALIQCLKIRQYPAGSMLFYEGEMADRLSFLIKGEVEIIKSLGTEDERCISSLKPVDIFGESSLLFPDRLRYASARTATEVLLLEMLHKDFEALILRQPRLGYHFMKEMTIRWGNAEQAIITELKEKNQQLVQAYEDLKRIQAQLIQKERIEHELALAQRIQQGILPKTTPEPAGWQITAHWQPAHAVGGDFYDFITYPNGMIGVMIGDATGKGVPAALVMATTCSVLRAIVAGMGEDPGLTPGEVLARANDLLCEQMPAGMFVTCLLALFNPENGLLGYANAGHCLPYQLGTEDVCELRATGMPLGLLPGMHYEDKQATVKPGEVVVLFSDGLLEAHNPQGLILGTPRVEEILASAQDESDLISRVLAALSEFTGKDWEQEDDLTLVAVQRNQQAS